MKRCPKCSSLMPADAMRCIRCGFESEQQSAPAPQQSEALLAAPLARQASAAEPGAGAAEKPSRRGRIRSGSALARQSLRVLMLDRGLLVFPLLSGISCFLLLASFVAGVWASGLAGEDSAAGNKVGWIVLFAYYFANYFVIVFFNSALVACAMIRFHGGVPTVGAGMRAARERLAQIAAWALLAATVGVLLKMIEDRVQIVGRIVIALLGAAWTIGSYFVVPVLVAEKAGPVDAFKRSVAILRKAWGESIVGNLGLGLITFLFTLGLLVLTGIATVVLAVNIGSGAIALAGMLVMVLIVVLSALAGSALNAIVLSALYLYATEGRVPEAFAGARLQQAFVAK